MFASCVGTKSLQSFVWAGALASCAGTAIAESYFVPVNMLPFANSRLQDRSSFPTGSLVLGDVPFRIETSGNNVWSAAVGPAGAQRVIEIPINIEGVKKVHTLINCDWGQAGPNSFARIEFVGADGTVITQTLVGNVNLRDWNQWVWTNTISASNTQQVVTVGNTRLDKQVWTMPLDIESQELRRIRIVDTGNENFQRIFVSGLSIEIDQPRPVRWPVEQGGNGNRYQWVQRPQGITWEQASSQAIAAGGWLATITSSAENGFVYSRLGGNQGFWRNGLNGTTLGPWIGGLQPANSVEPLGGWQWVTNEAFGFANWAAGEPNNLPNASNEDRIHYFSLGPIPAANTWNDLPGSALLSGYVIELPPCNKIDFNNDGLFPDDTDLLDFLSVLAGGACSTGNCDSIDFNDDGLFPDDADLIAFLTVLSGGSC